jgi:haloacetate dehalogenase
MTVDTGEATSTVTRSGSGPELLLLRGFPQTRLMRREIAELLAERFTVVCADLRGYGESSCRPPLRTDDRVPGAGAVEWCRAAGVLV